MKYKFVWCCNDRWWWTDSNDVDHPFELQGNMRIDGDIYSFSSGVRGYPRSGTYHLVLD